MLDRQEHIRRALHFVNQQTARIGGQITGWVCAQRRQQGCIIEAEVPRIASGKRAHQRALAGLACAMQQQHRRVGL